MDCFVTNVVNGDIGFKYYFSKSQRYTKSNPFCKEVDLKNQFFLILFYKVDL